MWPYWWPWVSRRRYLRDLQHAFNSRDAARRAYDELCARLPAPTYHGIPLVAGEPRAWWHEDGSLMFLGARGGVYAMKADGTPALVAEEAAQNPSVGTVTRYREGKGWHTVPIEGCADDDRSGGAE